MSGSRNRIANRGLKIEGDEGFGENLRAKEWMRDFVVVDLSYCHISNVGLSFDRPSVTMLNHVRKCEENVKCCMHLAGQIRHSVVSNWTH